LSSARTLIAVDAEGSRLDTFLARRLAPEYSRAQIARAIKAGLVLVNHRPARASAPVHASDLIELLPAAPSPPPIPAAAPAIEVLYADAELIFVNKPAGMAVHPAPGHPHSTLVDALLARFPELAAVTELDGTRRAGIVHRLDKDTSGVMVVARSSFARAALSAQFKQRSVAKTYIAICAGWMERDTTTIALPIGRHPVDRKRMSVRTRAPRAALSEVRQLARLEIGPQRIAASLLAVTPHTGRTHQIRVHLAAVGHACLGDPVYGRRNPDVGLARQALHALRLAVDHPRTGARITVSAPLPADLLALLERAGLGPARVAELLAQGSGLTRS
jgi:23S rRNA pseudouridine1911/1915/1917 synthase